MELKEAIAKVELVTIEMSNYCNLAWQHKLCPASQAGKLITLPLHTIEGILIDIGAWGYRGLINLFRYSEPTADPRLFLVMEMVQQIVPRSRISMSTNGVFLNEDILEDLVDRGLAKLHVSLYGPEEKRKETWENVQAWAGEYPDLELVNKHPKNEPFIDWFLQSYEREYQNCDRPCGAPLRQINISCEGDVVLCCRDWKNVYKFGNIKRLPLDVIIMSPIFQEFHTRLSSGDRTVCDYCMRCRSVH
jgi:MoaA/NifB/PqqE/SkfB family radical SAM enzyme